MHYSFEQITKKATTIKAERTESHDKNNSIVFLGGYNINQVS